MAPPQASESDIAAAYRLILDRDARPGEPDDKQGRTRDRLFLEFLTSAEFVERRLPAIRELLMQRFTDYYVHWLDRYHSIVARFRQGQTLFAQSSDNAEFVLVSYLLLLRRLPDPFGFLHYFRLLEEGGLGRSGLTSILEGSAEGLAIKQRPPLEQIEIMDYLGQSESLEGNEAAQPVQLLIVSGPPRSGTTALTALLNADHRICVSNESRVFSIPDQIIRATLLGELSMSRTGVFEVLSELLNKHARNVTRSTLAGLRKCDVILDRSRLQVSRRPTVGVVPVLVGDKNPSYLADHPDKAGKISAAFPEVPSRKW
jgi:hypothetical protein